MTTAPVQMEIQFDPLPMPENSTVWVCQECEEVATDEPDLDKLYECTECGDKFTSTNGGGKNGNMCPNCGNKFGTRIDEGDKYGAHICPSCEQGVAEETEMQTCPWCDWNNDNAGEIDTDEYVKHVFSEHADELSYSVVEAENSVGEGEP